MLPQVLNQFGHVLVAAALIDTVFVRTFLVPALLHVAVDHNWWPGSVPPGVLDDLDSSGSDDEAYETLAET